ncbi:hypothetical protein Dthio_PD1408 [Desulfonatronospira thiodismutans ASO3-1]|uniref:Uncharacterized protein n=1 Tax=Desulfonatronospira thiodismutans ASO3-1 TaxID=555779 RepID=D6STQ3_9BACT|nr:hypothetical protein Dthio_PD1408 [Desulfonatronospira thiodismutans ASO3-1]
MKKHRARKHPDHKPPVTIQWVPVITSESRRQAYSPTVCGEAARVQPTAASAKKSSPAREAYRLHTRLKYALLSYGILAGRQVLRTHGFEE